MRGGEFAQPWGIPVYKTCLSVHWSWLDFCVLPSSFRKVSPPLGFQTRFAIRSLEDCMLHVSECVWHCYHHYQPLTTLSAKWSFQDFVLWTEYINQWVRTGATGLKLCLCGRQLCLSKICFFFFFFFILFLRYINSEPRSQPWGGQSLIRTYRNGFKKLRKYTLTFHLDVGDGWGHIETFRLFMIAFLGLFVRGFVVVCCFLLREACRQSAAAPSSERFIFTGRWAQTVNIQCKTSRPWAFPADCVVKRLLVEQPAVSVLWLIVVYWHFRLVLVPLWCTREATREGAFDVSEWNVYSGKKKKIFFFLQPHYIYNKMDTKTPKTWEINK